MRMPDELLGARLFSPEATQGWRLFADDALTTHLEATVFSSSPADAQALSYFLPPRLTTFRITSSALPPTSGASPPLGASPLRSMASVGLDDAILYVASHDSNVVTDAAFLQAEFGPFALAIVLDIGCAEAVLRGSDVFSPGVLASAGPKAASYGVGDIALLVFAPVATGSTSPGTPKKGSILHDARGFLVVGVGQMAMARPDLLASVSSGAGGIACVNKWNGGGQPSRAALARMVSTQWQRLGAPESPPITEQHIFLQNFSSLVPATLLVNFLTKVKAAGNEREVVELLDMCAAPGGKSSHILSRALSSGWAPGSFHLTSCERSAGRCKQLQQLLISHFGDAFVPAHVKCVAGDANRFAKELENDPKQFDGILLDPPCTGLGLRPRLASHPHTVDDVRGSADYQRKLMDTAVQLIRPGGVISYSTCTITAEENEENVAAFLARYPHLRLADSSDFAEGVLEKLRRLLPHRGGNRAFMLTESLRAALTSRGLSGDAGDDVAMMRFAPCQPSVEEGGGLDSVGFFVAVFVRSA